MPHQFKLLNVYIHDAVHHRGMSLLHQHKYVPLEMVKLNILFSNKYFFMMKQKVLYYYTKNRFYTINSIMIGLSY